MRHVDVKLAFKEYRNSIRLLIRGHRLHCRETKRTLLNSVYVLIRKLQLTLWMRDHGVSYKTEQNEKQAWLDKLLWLCAIGDASTAKSEVLMKECVILNLFNQLRTGLSTAESYPLTVDCATERDRLTNCIITEAPAFRSITNANVIKKLLLYIRQAKSDF